MAPAWGRVGIEGMVAKPAAGRYQPGKGGWWKDRPRQTTEAVIGAATGMVAAPDTLLLGRYDAEGQLRMVARTKPLSATIRRELGELLALERLIARTARAAAHNLQAEGLEDEAVAAGLGLSAQQARSRVLRYRLGR
ncbi:hypothetical protein ACWGUP_28805 [Streptomyces diastaticus]|uniref:hypothetical protein n=1 Tax=Streptomyces diastaticus TaxID=1956 RepID=UPI0034288575